MGRLKRRKEKIPRLKGSTNLKQNEQIQCPQKGCPGRQVTCKWVSWEPESPQPSLMGPLQGVTLPLLQTAVARVCGLSHARTFDFPGNQKSVTDL